MRRHSRCCAIRNVGIVPHRLCTHTQRVTWYLHTHFHTVTWYLYTHFHSHVVFAHTLPQSRGICTHTSTQSRDIYERHVLIDRVECFIGYTWTVLPHGWSVSQSEMFWTFKHWKQYKCCSEKNHNDSSWMQWWVYKYTGQQQMVQANLQGLTLGHRALLII